MTKQEPNVGDVKIEDQRIIKVLCYSESINDRPIFEQSYYSPTHTFKPTPFAILCCNTLNIIFNFIWNAEKEKTGRNGLSIY